MTVEKEFMLYDLTVEVHRREGRPFACGHAEGPAFRVSGEDIIYDQPGAFSLYALAALIPLLPGMQRALDTADWMSADTDVACPDANCGAVFRIRRTGRSTFPAATPDTPTAGR
jgi:uncharacterized repeat protein (TIGR04076 family)